MLWKRFDNVEILKCGGQIERIANSAPLLAVNHAEHEKDVMAFSSAIPYGVIVYSGCRVYHHCTGQTPPRYYVCHDALHEFTRERYCLSMHECVSVGMQAVRTVTLGTTRGLFKNARLQYIMGGEGGGGWSTLEMTLKHMCPRLVVDTEAITFSREIEKRVG